MTPSFTQIFPLCDAVLDRQTGRSGEYRRYELTHRIPQRAMSRRRWESESVDYDTRKNNFSSYNRVEIK